MSRSLTKPHVRMVRGQGYVRIGWPNTLLRWICASERAVGYGTTPKAAYNDWLLSYRGDRS